MNGQTIAKFEQEIRDLQQKKETLCEEVLSSVMKGLGLKVIGVAANIPSFNDGDACFHTIGSVFSAFAVDGEVVFLDEYGEEEKLDAYFDLSLGVEPSKENMKSLKVISGLISSHASTFQEIFREYQKTVYVLVDDKLVMQHQEDFYDY